MKDLHTYRETVERFARCKSSEVFSNGQPAHAAIILETFLKYAQKRVVIFCERMSEEVFGTKAMSERIEAAIRKGVRVDILVQKEPEAKGLQAQITEWSSDSKLQIRLDRAPEYVRDLKGNFATMDGEAYRLEPDRNETKAHACMFGEKIAQDLEDIFFRLQAAAV